MFHEGDLQSGIALAMQQSKAVACFVRDDSTESTEWENEWLQGSEISQLLQAKSIVLRILAGSPEAGHLSALLPVKEFPTLAFIHNGQVVEFLQKGISKDEFETRIRKALGGETDLPAGETAPAEVPVTASRAAPPPPTVEDEEVPSASAPAATAQLLREEREARTKASKGKQKQVDPPEEPTPADTNTTQAAKARSDWLEQQKQRKSDAKRERERVMAQIEADKAERRAKREQEKQARDQQALESAAATQAPSSVRQPRSNAKTSNLQVRLLDGGQIRRQFSADASLEKDVRPWIDENLETKAPYTFKQILAPQPARAISTGEEHSSLRDLDLIPSATLVLQPVTTYSDAYEGGSGGLMSLPYNAVTGAYGLVSGTLSGAANWLRGGLFRPEDDDGGRTLAQAAQQETHADRPSGNEGPAPRAAQSRGNIRVRTLADQRDGSTDQQFYNGNSLDFAPNPDESSRKLD